MFGIVADSIYKKHLTGAFHPESPSRYEAIMRHLGEEGLVSANDLFLPREALEEDILRCHSKDYLEILEKDTSFAGRLDSDDGSYTLSTGDVQICSKSLQVAKFAAGAVITAVDLIMKEEVNRVFCLVRPPGHHACRSIGMGFCLLNNVAIGVCYAKEKYKVNRVFIVDWDVHHGNGTQEIFDMDPSVFYFSVHRAHFYPPGTGLANQKGEGLGKGFSKNFPIESGWGSRKKVLEVFENDLPELIGSFRPDMVFISAGFDGHLRDPLGGFCLEEADYGFLSDIVVSLADYCAKGRVVSVLEGGYDLKALALSTASHIRSLSKK